MKIPNTFFPHQIFQNYSVKKWQHRDQREVFQSGFSNSVWLSHPKHRRIKFSKVLQDPQNSRPKFSTLPTASIFLCVSPCCECQCCRVVYCIRLSNLFISLAAVCKASLTEAALNPSGVWTTENIHPTYRSCEDMLSTGSAEGIACQRHIYIYLGDKCKSHLIMYRMKIVF